MALPVSGAEARRVQIVAAIITDAVIVRILAAADILAVIRGDRTGRFILKQSMMSAGCKDGGTAKGQQDRCGYCSCNYFFHTDSSNHQSFYLSFH